MIIEKRQSGFTLVEIIIVIAIMGIIGGLSALIIGRSLDSYAALERRENLQTSIRLAVERMSRELRHALPNSICVSNGGACIVVGAGSRFHFIPVIDSGRYQDRPGAYVGGPAILRDRLPVLPLTSDRFDVLSTNNANRLNAIAGNLAVVYNLNNTDVYAGINNVAHPINAIVQKDIHNDGDANTDIDQIQFGVNRSFANHSPTRRFHIIDNTQQVTLFSYDAINRILTRDTTTFAAPNAAINPRLLIQNVEACNFTFTPGAPQRAGLLRIDITVTEQGETIQVIHNAHVYNTP